MVNIHISIVIPYHYVYICTCISILSFPLTFLYLWLTCDKMDQVKHSSQICICKNLAFGIFVLKVNFNNIMLDCAKKDSIVTFTSRIRHLAISFLVQFAKLFILIFYTVIMEHKTTINWFFWWWRGFFSQCQLCRQSQLAKSRLRKQKKTQWWYTTFEMHNTVCILQT